jgi:hypothetical protein
MLTICAVCEVVLKEGPKGWVSHGLCRLHELEGYEEGGCLKWWEAVELFARQLLRR